MDAERGSLPDFINHPIHRQRHTDPLRLESSGGAEDSSCTICGKHFGEDELIYSCTENCGFKLDLECSSTRYVVEVQPLHEHPLCFIEQVNLVGGSCHVCGKRNSGLPMFLCSEGCKFSLHLVCGPLPCSVQYNGYELTLTDSLIDNTGPDDVWCDVCEERRDPAECVYYDPDTQFKATVDCLLPQIVAALKGDLGDVELRTIGQHMPGKVMGKIQVEDRAQPPSSRGRYGGARLLTPLEKWSQDMFEKENKPDQKRPTIEETLVEQYHLTDEQTMRLLTPQDVEQLANAFVFEPSGSGFAREDSNHQFCEGRWSFGYSDDAFKQFKERLPVAGINHKSYLTTWRTDSLELVQVGNNLVPSQFVSIYRELVDEYGDFSEGSVLSPTAKAIVFNLFFSIVYSMRGYQVGAVSDELLCTWLYNLTCVRDAGFKIQFVFDNLEKLVPAHFGVKVIKFRDGTTKVLEDQVEEAASKIHEKEAKLGELKSLQEKYKKPKEAEESFMKQCLVETAKWKWNNVGDLIF